MADRENLLTALENRLEQVAISQDLAPVIRPGVADEAAQLTSMLQDDSDLHARLLLGWLHWYRYHALPPNQDEPDLNAAIAMFTPSFITGVGEIPPPLQALLAERTSTLAKALLAQALTSRDLKLISTAVDLWERIVDVTASGHPDRGWRLSGLAAILQHRFESTGVTDDLYASIEAGKGALDVTPIGHPGRPSLLANQGTAFVMRYQRFGSVADLDAGIALLREATEVILEDRGRGEVLSNLGNAWRMRFDRTGELADLDSAVRIVRDAVQTTVQGDLHLNSRLANLATVLFTRFGRTGAKADLDSAADAARQAVQVSHHGDLNHGAYLHNLGIILRARFARTGTLADIDEAVDAGQRAVDATPPDHPQQGAHLSDLCFALLTRFERTGALADIDQAVDAGQRAVDATPDDLPERSAYLTNLSLALFRRYERTGELADLDSGLRVQREAIHALPAGHPATAGLLANLGGSLRSRFQRTKRRTDLEEAIGVGRRAVEGTPPDHPQLGGNLSNLSLALLVRFLLTGAQADVDDAISVGRQAVDAIAPDDPRRAALLCNLGTALLRRSDHTGAETDRDAGISAAAEAAGMALATPSQRILAARLAARYLAESEPSRAADLLEGAVRLLPETAPRRLHRSDQQYAVGTFAGLASEAAALVLAHTAAGAISTERSTRALQLLETGRAVLLSQALDARDDLSDLRGQHPDLAERFADLRDRLDQPEDSSSVKIIADVPGGVATAPMVEQRQLIAEEFAQTLAEIRALDGFSSFGLPPTADQLLAEARWGPVVTFNVSSRGCGALLLTADGIRSLELPMLTIGGLIGKIDSFRQALQTARDPEAVGADRAAAQRTLAAILGWLWDTVAEPVLDNLGYRETPQAGTSWPRVWWAPGGLLGVLPIHAAGHHSRPPTAGAGRPTVMDRVISSYTPTIRALRYARQHASNPGTADRALIVGMPVTPGLPSEADLPNVLAEVVQVSAMLPDPVILTEPSIDRADSERDQSRKPTRANVFAYLPGCSIAHFACHGTSDPRDPSQSLLVLHDFAISPLTVASLAPIQHDNLQLVYLSACRTAFTSATDLRDEAIHITSAFQLAGSRNVIGTLWEINDAVAVLVASSFYTFLLTGSRTLDTSLAADALHGTVRAVRDLYPKTPSLWAAYLHVGA